MRYSWERMKYSMFFQCHITTASQILMKSKDTRELLQISQTYGQLMILYTAEQALLSILSQLQSLLQNLRTMQRLENYLQYVLLLTTNYR